MRTTKRLFRSGFTLIESMLASVVLAACAVGMCGVLMASAQNGEEIDGTTACVDAARLNLENLAAKRLANLSSVNGAAITETIDPAHLNNSIARTEASGIIEYKQRTATQAARDIAVVSVTTRTDTGQTVMLYQILTRAEVHR